MGWKGVGRVGVVLLWVVVVWGLLCGGGFAAEYHVATGGDNQNDGSASSPWATVSHAVRQVQAGDTVFVHSGTYLVTEQIHVGISGREGEPITLSGYGEERPLLDLRNCPFRNGFEVYFADHIVIENFQILAPLVSGSRGIRLTHADHVIVRNITVSGAGHANLFCSHSHHVTFENNEASNGGIGIYVADSSDYATIRGNRLHNHQAIGLHMNGDISSGGDGIISFALVENNVIYRNGATGINCDGVTDSVFRNNLIYDNVRRGIAFFQGDGAVPSNDNQVLHNTVVMPSTGYYAIGLNYGAVRNGFWNNILLTEGTVPAISSTSPQTALQVTSDYNLLPTHLCVVSTSSGQLSLSQWRALGHDASSLAATLSETFARPDQNDFRPFLGSPVINAGTSAHSWPMDLAGYARPNNGQPDMGCYEFLTFVYVSGSGSCGPLLEPCYDSIPQAIQAAYSGTRVWVEEGTWPDQLVLEEDKRVRVEGGWDGAFTHQLPHTTFLKAPAAPRGTLTLEMVTIRP